MTQGPTTKVWLDGEQYDLEVAAEQFAIGPTRVIVGADRRGYITNPALDSCPQGDVLATAQPLVDLVNAGCRIVDGNYRAVTLSNVINDADGGVVVYATAAFGARGRAHMTVVVNSSESVTQHPQPTFGQRLAVARDADADVAEIVRLMGRAPGQLDWFGLVKAYEFVRKYADRVAAEGDGKSVVKMGWATKQEIDDFAASANHPDLSGDAARHAVRPDPPTGNEMDIAEAQTLIARLVGSVIGHVL